MKKISDVKLLKSKSQNFKLYLVRSGEILLVWLTHYRNIIGIIIGIICLIVFLSSNHPYHLI